ncbi:MAG: glycosyltransferase family 4 protein [Solirubrobacteraceae bacterium]
MATSETLEDEADAAPAGAAAQAGPQRIGAIGVSLSRTCGVRDHAVLLAEALARSEGIDCALHWAWREEAAFRRTRAQMRGWLDQLRGELHESRPEALLLHYSVFAFSYRGLPVFVRPALSAQRDLGIPLVTLLHEYAYPWHLGGVRGKGWALSQRALLFEVMRASAAVAVTAEFRADWLSSRTWLPRRRTVIAPVFSNLPAAGGEPARQREGRVVGLFGYAHEGIAKQLVLDALRLLAERGAEADLLLLGAPGPDSEAARGWLAAAQARGIAAPRFSGLLPAQGLADALAGCDVLLSADRIGPTSRRTTLAASLASSRPVVALDGRHTWPELRRREAARIVAPTPDALAGALQELLDDPSSRDRLGASGAEFARKSMSAEGSARILAALLADVSG